ncbi:MAG: dihydrodipicolinate synthase family protein [Acidobacteria bacterium]|nr:MAG: dihydrodipicolinate synthase family protein [Acidobacteriota bacterium]
MRFEGIFAALTTPFAPDGSVALDKFRENLARYNRTHLRGYVVVGSTGESVLLSFDEIDRIWNTARESAAPGKLLIAGAGVDSTSETIARSRRAAELGYDAVLIKTPHYFKALLTPVALERHYMTVADASPLPVLIYSIPQYTGISITADWVARLAEHPNIVGIKESSGNLQLISEIIHLCPPKFSTLVGSAGTLFLSLLLGGAGGVLALACFLPEAAVEIYEAVRAGDTARASRLQFTILYASRKIAGELGPTGVKYAMDCVGYYGGDPRPPLCPLTEAQRKTVEAVLAESIARQKLDDLGVAR